MIGYSPKMTDGYSRKRCIVSMFFVPKRVFIVATTSESPPYSISQQRRRCGSSSTLHCPFRHQRYNNQRIWPPFLKGDGDFLLSLSTDFGGCDWMGSPTEDRIFDPSQSAALLPSPSRARPKGGLP